MLGTVATLPVELKAEAYDIKVQVEWPTYEGQGGEEEPPAYQGLDFGSFKVVDEQRRPKEGKGDTLTLINEGKYEVGFKFVFKSKLMRSILTLTPNEASSSPPTRAATRRGCRSRPSSRRTPR